MTAGRIDASSVFRSLCDSRFRPDQICDRSEPGVYAIFAKMSDCFPSIVLPQSGLVYVGESRNLAKRNHFKAEHSGFSSPRRSFGALLKSTLRLTAEPRLPGPSPRNYVNYRFGGDGEMRLSTWMRDNLMYTVYPFHGNLRELEERLIKENEPPLNLTKWRNPQKWRILGQREVCKNEAKLIWSVF